MFQNAYQGGTHVEIYDAKGIAFKTPHQKIVNKDKEKSYANLYKMTTPQGYSKIFDKDIKGYIYSIDGHSTKMRFPKDEKVDLCIVQHFLVFQIYLPFGSPWNLEIGLADTSKVNRRINLVSALNKIETKYFHVKVPNDIIKRGVWLNLSIDVNSFMDAWKGQTFRSIDSITIGSSCKLRRVFSMKNPLFEFNSDIDQDEQTQMQQSGSNQQKQEDIPKNFAFPPGFQYENQFINYQKIMENVDPKYLENISQSMDIQKSNVPIGSSMNKSTNKNQANNIQGKNIATKPLKNNLNSINQKQQIDFTLDFNQRQESGQKEQTNEYDKREEKNLFQIQNSYQQNSSKITSSTKRETSVSSSNNLDEESKFDTQQAKTKNRQQSKELGRQQIQTQKPPQTQNSGNKTIQQQRSIPKSPINSSSLVSPLISQKETQQSNSNQRQSSKNQQRQGSLQKKESSLAQKNNPWYANRSSKQQIEDKDEEKDIEENIEAEYYDQFEFDEEPKNIKNKDQKNTLSLKQQKELINGDKNLKDGTNKNRITEKKGNNLLKEKPQTQQLEQKRNVKSANNFVKKASLLDPKKVSDQQKKNDIQKKENKSLKHIEQENDGTKNKNSLNNMNTDIDDENYFQLTQKFNTVSDPKQFKDIFSQSKQKNQIEESYGNQSEFDDHDSKEIEEDIETEQYNQSGLKKGVQSKLSHNNPNQIIKTTNKKELLKQSTVESRKYQMQSESQNFDNSAEGGKQKFEDSLEGPYIQKDLNNYDEEELGDKFNFEQKEDQRGNSSLHNYNIYENHLNKFINNQQRPFTPPFQSVVPLQGSSIITKKNGQTVVIQNQQNNEYDPSPQNKSLVSNKVRRSSSIKNDQDQVEVIFDPVLNCYYDPSTKQYYELKS